ncbi:class I SAM-dependent methyltransferase [Paraburkholderia atlantica]|uniref:class I SAM-dependent methyltransferase n=1 Tax=Paraburkholderia atlantica TaxID=2654982 RepID=UPI003D2289D5
MSIEDARLRVTWTLDALPKNIPVERFQGAKVLDIGCGTGNGVIAALKLGAKCAVGVDRDAKEFGYPYFEEVAAEFGVDTRSAVLLEADVFKTSFFDGGFDVVMMYDAIEHVPDPKSFIDMCGRYLRPGGLALVVTCPLYYSAVGHHLWQHFPEETMPWAHLYFDFEQRLSEAGVGDWGLQRFYELNKVTRSQLLDYIRECGLSLVADNSYFPERFPPLLEKFGHLIDMSLVPSKDDLLCDYVSLLFKKA